MASKVSLIHKIIIRRVTDAGITIIDPGTRVSTSVAIIEAIQTAVVRMLIDFSCIDSVPLPNILHSSSGLVQGHIIVRPK